MKSFIMRFLMQHFHLYIYILHSPYLYLPKKITKDIKNASNTYKFLSPHTHILTIIIIVTSNYKLVLDLPPSYFYILSFIPFYAQLPAYLHTYTYKTYIEVLTFYNLLNMKHENWSRERSKGCCMIYVHMNYYICRLLKIKERYQRRSVGSFLSDI